MALYDNTKPNDTQDVLEGLASIRENIEAARTGGSYTFSQIFSSGTIAVTPAAGSPGLDVDVAEPFIRLGVTGTTAKGYVQARSGYEIQLASNILYTAGAYVQQDATKPSWRVQAAAGADKFLVSRSPAGSVVLVDLLKLTSTDLDVTTSAAFTFGASVALGNFANFANLAIPSSVGVRLTGGGIAAGANLSGMTGGRDGRLVYVFNVSGFTITVQHENAGSTAANRFWTRGGANVAILNGEGRAFVYDTVVNRWIQWGA